MAGKPDPTDGTITVTCSRGAQTQTFGPWTFGGGPFDVACLKTFRAFLEERGWTIESVTKQ